jgi:hypothetical protein
VSLLGGASMCFGRGSGTLSYAPADAADARGKA